MKNSLLALAILGTVAGAASAQSSVTIYGLLDQGLSKGNGGTAPNAGANGTSKAWLVRQSSSSRLGFRGNEDLGGGLSAQFQIEHRFTPDDGIADALAFWQGRTYIQLTSAALGRVYLGREYTPAFWLAVKSDPFGWDGVAQLSTMQFAGFGSGALSTVRTNNTIGYQSPSLSGLTVQGAVGLGEGTFARNTSVNVEYAAGPIYAALGYENLKGGPLASNDGNSLFNIALHYDLGFVKPMFYFARAEVAGGSLTNKFVQIGALAPIGAGMLKAAYARLTPDSANAATRNAVGAGNGAQTKLGLGYNYPLSKRTNVYGDLSTARKAGTVGNVTGGTEFTNNNAFAFGLRHVF